MKKTYVNRRQFVETAVLGAGCLTLAGSTSAVLAAMPADVTTVLASAWKQNKDLTMAYAEAMPEEHYGFKPTPDIRSFAEQLLHIAGANYFLMSRVKGEKPALDRAAFEAKDKSKADVIKLLEQGFEIGGAAVGALTEETAKEEVPFAQSKMPKWKVALFVMDHLSHHRGQTVIYLRLKGIKPPEYRSGFFA